MVIKSNPKTASNIVSMRRARVVKPAPAHVGITFAMRAREILYASEVDAHDIFLWLDPVPVGVFALELSLMQKHGYKICETEGNGLCPRCDGPTQGVTYFRRHRNGKKDFDSGRSFDLCLECLHVTEAKLITKDKNQDDIHVTVLP